MTRAAISLTPRFSGVITPAPEIRTVSTVFRDGAAGTSEATHKTVKTVPFPVRLGATSLKRGVNERGRHRHGHVANMQAEPLRFTTYD